MNVPLDLNGLISAQPSYPTDNVQASAQVQAEAKKLEKKIDQSILDPGKSLSITDIVNVGGQQAAQTEKASDSVTNQAIKEAMDQATGETEQFKPSMSGQGFRVDLTNEDGAGYTGTIYLGSDDTPVKVLFDTGSDYLAVTSDLCLDPKLGKQEEDVPVFDSKNFQFKPSGKDLRKCKSTAFATKSSTSAKALNEDEKLDYGSAKLSGKLY